MPAQVVVSLHGLLIPAQTMEVLNQSSSVVGISVMASEAAAEVSRLLLCCWQLFPCHLVVNLLPIPPLDGGKILLSVQVIIKKASV